MAQKDVTSTQATHLEHDPQATKLSELQRKTEITHDIPLQQALESHLDEDPKRLARIKRKVDLRLTLTLAVLYTFAFIDRGNLGNANIAGMGDALGLDVGSRYSVVTMVVRIIFTYFRRELSTA